MNLRTCQCGTLVDADQVLARSEHTRFGDTQQEAVHCPKCDSIVVVTLLDEDADSVYSVDAQNLSSIEAEAVAKKEKHIKDCVQTAAAYKPGRNPAPPEE